jgi:hypothetical protein
MAAYAATVTLDFPTPIHLGNAPMAIIIGQCALTNYNTTPVAITGITGRFRAGGKLRVIPDSISTTGHAISWDEATSSFLAYVSADLGGVLVEAADDVNCGVFGFTAIGQT